MYIKYKWDWFDNGKEYDTYIEIEEGYVTRQIMQHDDRYIASNREDQEMEFFLAEGYTDTSDFEEANMQIIHKDEFERIWTLYSETISHEWLKIKEEFVIGTEVEGKLRVFYPHGIIIEISNNIIGVANYDECAKNSDQRNLYPNHIVMATVKGYDETNMWLILDNTKAY